MSWTSLLKKEQATKKELEALDNSQKVTLWTDFVPNPGGQAEFFRANPMQTLDTGTHRWTGAIGGINCLAGETLINGVPIAELKTPSKVDTLMGEAWATPSFIKGQADLYRLETKSGRVVLATLDHRVLLPTGWGRVRDLRVGALIAADGNGSESFDPGISKGSPGYCSSDFHPCGELLAPEQVVARSRSQRFHKLVCGENALWEPILLSMFRENGVPLHQLDALGNFFDVNVFQLLLEKLRNLELFQPRFHPRHRNDIQLSPSGGYTSPFCSCIDQLQGLLQTLQLCVEPYALTNQSVQQLSDSFCTAGKPKKLPHKEILELHQFLDSNPFSSTLLKLLPQIFQGLQPFFDSSLNSTKFQQLCQQEPFVSYPHNNNFWDEVIHLSFARHDDFYDLHVPVHEHYSANGLWHHNSGKTTIGAVWTVDRALKDPTSRGLITANSFPQLAQSTIVGLVEVCRKFNVPLDPWRESAEDQAIAITNLRRCYIGEKRAFFYVLSMGSFFGKKQTSRGLQVRSAWLDECAYAPEQSFTTLDGRLGRGPGKLRGQGIMTTSPAGFNWLYYRLADPTRSDELKKLYIFISCPTIENSAHLEDNFVLSLQSSYTDELAQQELEGLFINTQVGRIYKQFSRAVHGLKGQDAEAIAYDSNLPLHLSFDFNASPSVAIAAHVRGNEIHCFKEFYLLDSDLWELMEIINEWLVTSKHQQDIYIYGDATGLARSNKGRESSWDIVFEELRKVGFGMLDTNLYKVHKRFDKVNPRIVNRINSVKCLLKQERAFFDLGTVPEVIKDLEELSWTDQGEVNKDDILRSHLVDAYGYMVHRIFPYRAPQAKTGMQKRKPRGLAA